LELVRCPSIDSSGRANSSLKTPKFWYLRLLDLHDLRKAIVQVTHDDCSFTMPALEQITHHVSMNSNERRINLHYLRYALQLINKIRYKPSNVWDPQAFAQVFGALTRLRQVAVAPFLLQEESKRKGVERALSTFDQITKDEELVLLSSGLATQTDIDFEKEQAVVLRMSKERLTEAGIGSSKMQMLVRVVANIPAGDKVLLFGNFTSSLDLAGLALEQVGIRSIALDGDTKDRIGTAILFAEDEAITAMRITYPVGSTGLNLTCANHVIFLEPWFNEGVLKQAAARAWRFGQKQTVYTHQLVTLDSIEPEMLKICSYKDQIAEEVLTGKARTLEKAKLNLPTLARMVEASLALNEAYNANDANQDRTREKKRIRMT
jgi:SNF2 family DNA or RNA helicase